MSASFIGVVYGGGLGCVSWTGYRFMDSVFFDWFLENEVADRLDDSQLEAEFFQELTTELGEKSNMNLARFRYHEERSWVASEALAEAFLEKDYKVVFPWNMRRDNRNRHASSSGADIVGLVEQKGIWRFALGEVKSSSEDKHPPAVMCGGRGSMEKQINALASDLDKVLDHIKWLFFKVRKTSCQGSYANAMKAFSGSSQRDIALFGVLVRDGEDDEHDLSSVGNKLSGQICSPKTCQLIALYLPWALDKLVSTIRAGDAS